MARAFSTKKPSIWLVPLRHRCMLGGWAAWMTGRAIADDLATVLELSISYLLILGGGGALHPLCPVPGHAAVAALLSIDAIVVLIIGSLGYRYTPAGR